MRGPVGEDAKVKGARGIDWVTEVALGVWLRGVALGSGWAVESGVRGVALGSGWTVVSVGAYV